MPCSHIAALWAANFSLCPTSVPSKGWSSVRSSKRSPSGACSIVIPVSPTRATPDASTSSIVSGTETGVAPAAMYESGSKPVRSVKRQCSSDFVGSGIAW
jgi:hypothetical protein